MSANLAICHRCTHRARNCAGPCPCTIDGRDIIEHARAADCPLGYHRGVPLPEPMPRTIPLAGDLAEAIAARLGADRLAKWWTRISGRPCRCADRKARLSRADAALRRRFGLKG